MRSSVFARREWRRACLSAALAVAPLFASACDSSGDGKDLAWLADRRKTRNENDK